MNAHKPAQLRIQNGGSRTLTDRDRAELRRKGAKARLRNAVLRLYDDTRLIRQPERAERIEQNLTRIMAMLEEEDAA
jgi:hypothetical protein